MPRTIRTIAVAGLTLGVLGLAACSSTGASQTDADGSTTVTLQSSWINDAEFMGYFVGLENGYYDEAGIDLEYLPGGPSVIPESTLLAGDADIALTSPDTTISAISQQGADLVIVGAQYQQNPLGVVSLVGSGIDSAIDLVGKTVAVPDVNRLAFEAMLAVNDIDPADVTVVPYAYDPTPLVRGEVDATLDFVTNVPYSIGEQGAEAQSFTLYDAGYRIPNDTVVVSRSYLESNRDIVKAFLEASSRGWEENFRDTAAYPTRFADSWFEGTGRTIANEEFFNEAQQPLIESGDGFYRMSDQSIQDTIDALALIDIEATPDMFDMSLFD